jgi:uncharacterized protein
MITTRSNILILSFFIIIYTVFADTSANLTAKKELEEQLRKSARNGMYQSVLDLIVKGADVNSQDEGPWFTGYTALHEAVRNKHIDIAELLIKSGADVNISDKEGTTPLMLASECGNVLLCKFINKKRCRCK